MPRALMRVALIPDFLSNRLLKVLMLSMILVEDLLVRGGSQIDLNNMRFEFNAADATHGFLEGNPLLNNPPVASGGGANAAVDENTLVTIYNSSFKYNSALNFGGNGGALNALVAASYKIISIIARPVLLLMMGER